MPRAILPILACLMCLLSLPGELRAQQAYGQGEQLTANGKNFRTELEAYSLLPSEREAASRRRGYQTLGVLALAGGAAAIAAIGSGTTTLPLAVAGSVILIYVSMP